MNRLTILLVLVAMLIVGAVVQHSARPAPTYEDLCRQVAEQEAKVDLAEARMKLVRDGWSDKNWGHRPQASRESMCPPLLHETERRHDAMVNETWSEAAAASVALRYERKKLKRLQAQRDARRPAAVSDLPR